MLKVFGIGVLVLAGTLLVTICVIGSPLLDRFAAVATGKLPTVPQQPSPPSLSLIQLRADVWQKMLGGTALLIGGVWALARFVSQRTNESALKIESTNTRVVQQGQRLVVFFEVIFENIGKVRISAQPRRYGSDNKLLPAYRHAPYEVLDFSVSLLIGPLPRTGCSQTEELGKQDMVLDWFSELDENLKPKDLVAEINLIDTIEVNDQQVNFWMEPGEIYHLPAVIELMPSEYLGMVTFIGNRGQFEFWRRFFLIQECRLQPRRIPCRTRFKSSPLTCV